MTNYYSALELDLLNSKTNKDTTQSYLISRPAPKTVGVELVGVEDVDGTFDAEVVKLTGHF